MWACGGRESAREGGQNLTGGESGCAGEGCEGCCRDGDCGTGRACGEAEKNSGDGGASGDGLSSHSGPVSESESARCRTHPYDPSARAPHTCGLSP